MVKIARQNKKLYFLKILLFLLSITSYELVVTSYELYAEDKIIAIVNSTIIPNAFIVIMYNLRKS